ncbi:hypothetical protein GWI33_019233 [Rhynchophorus ferrugineus]|uniref:Uncharacterized protein n=1 Tax=Rhynchophorus ferrugineus TaxID=354439 RepID=A0A834M5I8_RHYFE|nr:hypothetical protein GWI33_019233 [Rhynchophorus ferrugineus]
MRKKRKQGRSGLARALNPLSPRRYQRPLVVTRFDSGLFSIVEAFQASFETVTLLDAAAAARGCCWARALVSRYVTPSRHASPPPHTTSTLPRSP